MKRRAFLIGMAASLTSPGGSAVASNTGFRVLTVRGPRAEAAWVLDRLEAFCDEMRLLDLRRSGRLLAGRLKRQKRWCQLPGLADGSLIFSVGGVSGGMEVRVILDGVRTGPRDDESLAPLDQTQQMKVLARLTEDLRTLMRRSCGSACTA